MDSWLVAAALTSALLHASWHAVVKSSSHTGEAMTAQMVGSALLVCSFWDVVLSRIPNNHNALIVSIVFALKPSSAAISFVPLPSAIS